MIDAHVHVWDPAGGKFGVRYPWLTPDLGSLYRAYSLADVESAMIETGVRGVVLVQASDSLAETRALLAAAARSPLPASVVGWLPVTDPAALAAALAHHRDTPALVGVRHLIHDDPDPSWMLRPDVATGLESLAEQDLSFDVVAETADLLGQLPTVARRHPGLTLVLDHLGKPPAGGSAWSRWADQLAAAAVEPNVVAKISGLGTGRPGAPMGASWAASVDHAIAVFGAQRLMVGSDWPVSTLAGGYHDIWQQTLACLVDLEETDREHILRGTAARVYQCPVTTTATLTVTPKASTTMTMTMTAEDG